MSTKGEEVQKTASEAINFLRAEKVRLTQIIDAELALRTASEKLDKALDLANEAGEILIEQDAFQVQELIHLMVGDVFGARKRKSHAELDELMNKKTGRIHAAS